MNKNLICPCCEEHYFTEEDNYEYCEVCGWQDDPVQRDDPDYDGGANPKTLNETKKEWEIRKKQRKQK